MNEEARNRRSIEFGQLVCEKLRRNPELIQVAVNNIRRWEEKGPLNPALEEWKVILNGPRERIYEILTGTDSQSQRIRSSSPFAGVLTQDEREQIRRKYIRHRS